METISAKELEQDRKNGESLLIDLRAEQDYRESHIPGAKNVPHGEFRGELDGQRGRPVILYCERGAFSMTVARQLEHRGYKVRSLVGGFRAWREQMGTHND